MCFILFYLYYFIEDVTANVQLRTGNFVHQSHFLAKVVKCSSVIVTSLLTFDILPTCQFVFVSSFVSYN
jgi:hypothetical protein